LTLHAIAEAQKWVECSVYANVHSTEIMLKKLGVDIENLIISQPDNGGTKALEL
jgi:RecA/RadA recombinase